MFQIASGNIERGIRKNIPDNIERLNSVGIEEQEEAASVQQFPNISAAAAAAAFAFASASAAASDLFDQNITRAYEAPVDDASDERNCENPDSDSLYDFDFNEPSVKGNLGNLKSGLICTNAAKNGTLSAHSEKIGTHKSWPNHSF